MTQRPTDHTLDCARAEALLEPFVDGELEPEEAAALRAHLMVCPSCAAELALAQRIQTGLRALPELEPSPLILDRVRAQAAAESAAVVPFARPAGRPVRRWAVPATLAAAIAGLLTTALLLRSPQPAPAPSSAQVQVAEQEARYALAYIGKVTRQASLTLRDDVLEKRVVLPTAMSAERPLDPRPNLALERHSTKGT